MQIDEIIKQMFSLTEKIATLSGGLSNVEKSLMKVEDYQSKLVDDNRENAQQVVSEVKAVRESVEELVKVNQEVVDGVGTLSTALSQVQAQPPAEKGPCPVCAEKDKMVADKDKGMASLQKDRKLLALAFVAAVLLLLIALGMNFTAIREVLGIVK